MPSENTPTCAAPKTTDASLGFAQGHGSVWIKAKYKLIAHNKKIIMSNIVHIIKIKSRIVNNKPNGSVCDDLVQMFINLKLYNEFGSHYKLKWNKPLAN